MKTDHHEFAGLLSRSCTHVLGVATLLIPVTLSFAAIAADGPVKQPSVDFDREIRPILSDHCFTCHGPDEKKRKAELRLDTKEGLFATHEGVTPVVPGRSAASELIQRVTNPDRDEIMPPPKSGKTLTPAQIGKLRQWVDEGAKWQGHWAFQAPTRPAMPAVRDGAWVRNPIDAWALARIEQEKLSPQAEADARTLIRRLSLDLTGLPPTPEEVDRFLGDKQAGAYAALVDRLLHSPHFGERMAQVWLDLARFADSDGYHDDTTRSMWQFRDYVIRSFNANKPFDQFTVEQIAGDLLPDATLEQRIASAFHRNGPTSSEGGADAKEYAAKYAVDRVNTTATTWLGVTLQCTECHDHKYDPFTTREFYQMFAFFNQVPENFIERSLHVAPAITTPTPEQESKLAELKRRVVDLEQEVKAAAEAPVVAPETAPDAAPAEPEKKTDSAAELKKQLTAAKQARDEFEKSIPRLRVMADVPQPRPTYILLRGDYRNPGAQVSPGVPAALGKMPEGLKPNRLALARWLTQPQHPLTARVMVNRLWQMIFGVGLVKTAEEFGTQGERPSHTEVLDWLAVEFIESGWDVKHILKLIVTSATYRQSSKFSPELQARDPENRLLARGPRFRLPAETVRDNALAIAGLLDRTRPVGGPSVKPYQPGDLWREFAYGDSADKAYVRDKGPDLYRRSVYTFWKRSVLYPSYAIFDAPNREVCTARRSVTNTPLQAYVLLNDETFVEAARVLAQKVTAECPDDFGKQLRLAFQLALARSPSAPELAAMENLHSEMLAEYRRQPAAAAKLLAVGDAPRPAGTDPVRLAAWTCVANAILNFDETITKE
ncbi:MAG: PSD1 and planctomycete cytochrome C domain-containing protein [Chthoniobacter sp.]|nr:PSD1 and planctomycete cytochrome C domain-containing protein [Chthoniobacter sp.]